MSRKRQDLPDADASAWARAMRDTRPLRRRKPAPPGETGEKTAPAPAPSAPRPARPARTTAPAPPSPRPLAAGDASDIDRRTAERLRRGRMPIDARIDLHGRTVAEAQTVLRTFLLEAAGNERRCVLVITGKGTRGTGAIRSALPGWLNDRAVRPLILTFREARPEHGGSGAFYVLLRRRR